ncbi:HAD-IA family hydrolase [Streptomyces sp. ET3-23]|uniref:HAD-IA family hydrolase n=1 Tax=Streptomyces sp. ET3-23 TaxID=2885643 RepID=UPI001D0FFFFB|nr:HAD-IA family hydrolase [Streptomyces sp. ET3-23]MCC2280338.1 HAD-IA family hydrolase [Streptomyces sp. ET3-23]
MSHHPADARPLQAVLFDMDGTLVDTEELWWQAVRHVASAREYELTDADLPDVLGRPVEHTAAHLQRVTGASAGALCAELHREFAARVESEVVPRPGALELLDELHRQGIRTALVTASPRTVVDIVLRSLGPERFAVSVTADDTPRTKPAPDPYLAAARALGVEPSACVAVEDTPTGVASAEAAGCPVLAVPSIAPVPAAPGRTVLDSLERADVALLEAMVTEGAFLVPAFTTRNGRASEPFRATVAGLFRGAGPVFAKAAGPEWVQVGADGTLTGTPAEAGTYEVVVTAGGGACVTVRIPVVGADERLVSRLRVMSWNLWLGGTPVAGHRAKQLTVLLDADVDVVALQETGGASAKELADALGWDHHQAGHNLGVISRYPVTARFGTPAPSGYGAAGVTVRLDDRDDRDCAVQDVTVWSAHLNYTPYGPYDACFGGQPVPVLLEHEEASGRVAEMAEVLRDMADDLARCDTTPVLLMGDFNTPSHLDWTRNPASLHGGCGPVPWPVTQAAEEAGLRDSYRVARPDPVRDPGTTWSPLHPRHEDGSGRPEPQDRIDYVLFAGRGLDVQDSVTLVTGAPRPWPDVAENVWPSDHAAVITTFTVR